MSIKKSYCPATGRNRLQIPNGLPSGFHSGLRSCMGRSLNCGAAGIQKTEIAERAVDIFGRR